VFFYNQSYHKIITLVTWKALKYHKKVTVSVDCFYFGFLFIRKEQAKQHFKIRVQSHCIAKK